MTDRLQRRAELVLAALVVAGLIATTAAFIAAGRLPAPFYLHPDLTLMDWFDTAWWAHRGRAFDVWRTVYPPSSFAFLRVVGAPGCYAGSAMAARACDGVGRAAIVLLYLAGVVLAVQGFRRADPATAPMRSVAFGLGLPMLFALERGNLVLLAFVAFAWANGRAGRSGWQRALATAVMINVKPYLILPALAPLIRREWRVVAIAGLATALLYVAGWAIIREGDPVRLIANTANWARYTPTVPWETLWYSTTYASLDLIPRGAWPDGTAFAAPVAVLTAVATPLIVGAAAVIVAALAVALVRPNAMPVHRAALLLLALVVIGEAAGGYTQVFLIFLLFLERDRGAATLVALVAGYLLCVPWDFAVGALPMAPAMSWLSGDAVTGATPIGLGMIVRPALILVVALALASDTILRARSR